MILLLITCGMWVLANAGSEAVPKLRAPWAALALANAAAAAMTLLLWLVARARKQFAWTLLFHSSLFGWLAWCAFPYFGELP